MTRASFEPASSTTRLPRQRRRPSVHGRSLSSMAAIALVLAACGGDDDASSESTTTTVAVTVAPTTTAAPTTTTVAPTTTTTLVLVTEGASLIVANASGINGAAGRMTDELAVAGFSTGSATNSTEGQLATTKVYFESDNPDAEAVANSVRLALGGGAIEVLEMGVPAPVETGETGDASIVVAMGNDIADKTLAQLQGREALPAEESGDESSDESSDEPASDDDG